MSEQGDGCSWQRSGNDHAEELRRQARVVDDLIERLGAVIRDLPWSSEVEGWRGPAADLFTAAVADQRAHLGREVYRLDSVRLQLRGAAAIADAEALAIAGVP
ncbi:MAG: hypothetical protein Q7J04_01905 [Microcella sp.]|nr:hypothetical protein [Microcella sp.]